MQVAPGLAGRVRLAVVEADGVSAAPAGESLSGEVEDLCGALRERHGTDPAAAVDVLQPARALYRAIGVDPTKTRPSSEALLRRVLRGESLPRISGPVDLANLLALRFLLPIGLYDADRLEGAIEARIGRPGESYAGIRKDDVHVAGRLVLVDRKGPFGNPTSDSQRAAITSETTRLLLVVFGPGGVSADRMMEHARQAGDAIERHLGGRVTDLRVAAAAPAQ